ncbi:MAG TPA: GntR family transcriptional regulator [Terracidiphilus sp.]|jgi:DNA-binding GntR family transcriptional regulator|nr:GntR family transcriptional regulator [Terracidiphilus sp.]
MHQLPVVKSVAVRDSVVEVIRQALYSRRFEPGQTLSDVSIAAEMEVSRGPVREALLLLVQEGLVSHQPNRGFSVVQLTAADVAEIHRVRVPLEATALVAAKAEITDGDLALLRELRNAIASEFIKGNSPACTQADIRFHSLIWERAGNSRLAATLQTLLSPYFAYGSLEKVHGDTVRSGETIAHEHDLIIDYLRGQSEMSAEDCIRFHLGL